MPRIVEEAAALLVQEIGHLPVLGAAFLVGEAAEANGGLFRAELLLAVGMGSGKLRVAKKGRWLDLEEMMDDRKGERGMG